MYLQLQLLLVLGYLLRPKDPQWQRQTVYIFISLPQVKARSAAREVIATYSVDDIFIELVIQLPQNYPLGSITVESGRRVGVAVQQWRNWMLQLSTYLTHQVETQTIMDINVVSSYKYILLMSDLQPEARLYLYQ